MGAWVMCVTNSISIGVYGFRGIRLWKRVLEPRGGVRAFFVGAIHGWVDWSSSRATRMHG
jgi:hypothetical protein